MPDANVHDADLKRLIAKSQDLRNRSEALHQTAHAMTSYLREIIERSMQLIEMQGLGLVRRRR
jgi:hypothetical protein